MAEKEPMISYPTAGGVHTIGADGKPVPTEGELAARKEQAKAFQSDPHQNGTRAEE